MTYTHTQNRMLLYKQNSKNPSGPQPGCFVLMLLFNFFFVSMLCKSCNE